MTREQYLKELKNNILSLTLDEQNEAIQYYSDYFEEADDDEKVISELGNPEELAKTIIEKFANALVDTKSSANEENNSEKDNNKFNGNSNALYFEFDKNKVTNLCMNFGAAEVVLIEGNKLAVETRGITAEAMNCYLGSDGVLTINNAKRLNINFWSHDRNSRIVPRILISIPNDLSLDKFKVSVGAGDFRAKDIKINCKQGNVDVGAGNLILKSIYGGKFNIRCGMGNLEYYGSLTGRTNLDCGMGNIKLVLKGKADDYSYDAKVGLGDFRFNNEKKSGVCQVLNNEKKENHFSVNCGMGSVSVKFE